MFRANVGKVRLSDGRWFDTGLPNGFSDLFAIKNGRIYFLEVKTENGKARPDQEKFLAVMRDKCGCVAGIVRSTEQALRLVNGGNTCWIENGGRLVCHRCGYERDKGYEGPSGGYSLAPNYCEACGADTNGVII